MIKASELRKGNYVSYYGETSVGYILGMSFSEFSNDSKIAVSIEGGGWCGTDLNDITPIPLTEDWLKKWKFTMGGEKLPFHRVLGLISIDIEYNLYFNGKFLMPCPKYVHTFQNLFYSLTSQELNANNE